MQTVRVCFAQTEMQAAATILTLLLRAPASLTTHRAHTPTHLAACVWCTS